MTVRISELLVHRFDAEARRAGRDIVDAGRVTIVEREPGFVLAEVRQPNEDVRDVGMRWDPDGSNYSAACTCDDFAPKQACEHLWSVVLAADAAPGAEPAAEPGSTRSRAREDWRKRVSELHGLVAASRRDPWSEVQSGARRIVYVLDPRESDPHGDLCLYLHAQARLKSGAWGVRRPFDATRAQIDRLEDPLDRLVLGSLRADEMGDPLRPAMGVRSVDLNAAQRELLLPRLAASGRLFLESTSREEHEPLGLDDAEPWTPVLALQRDEQGAEVRLDGALTRGNARIPLDEPAWISADGWMVVRGKVARLDARGALELLLELRAKGPLRAPSDVRAELEASLLEAPGGARIEVKDAREEQTGAGDHAEIVEGVAPRPRLRVHAPRMGSEEQLDCRIAFEYEGVEVECGDARGLVKKFDSAKNAAGAKPTLLRRDFAGEAARLGEFVAHGGVPDRENPGQRDGWIEPRDLPVMVSGLLAKGWSIDAQGKRYRRAGAVKLSIQSGIDWFDLKGGIDFDGQVASMPALLAAAKRGANTVQLGDGSIGLLPQDWLERWSMLEVSGDAKGERVRFKKSQGWLLDALLAERGDVEVDQGFVQWRERLASFQGIEAREEPKGFRGELRPYQREGLGWFQFLRELGFGGCLADDMGLGKTVQVLALLQERKQQQADGKPTLVVAPKSLTFNWRAEAQRFTPELAVLDYSGIDRTKLAKRVFEHDIVVTTYGTLRQDAAFFKDVDFDYVILDEAQAIKNPQSQVAKAARLLRADHKLVLTGTPVENHLGELWSLFEFSNPGMLGRSSLFRSLFTGRAELALEEERRQTLARALRPFFLRRTKEQVLKELPEKSEQVIWCDLDEKERAEYDAIAAHFRASLLAAGGEIEGAQKLHVLEALLRLRQASCHPGLLDKSRAADEGAKFEVLTPLLEEIVESEHKALVFSQFTSFLALLRPRLEAAGWEYAYLDGSTRDRQAEVERFQNDPKCKLFLISLKAGGFGLNLTAADYVFLLDPWWNPASETQAIDRAHRIGQTRNVMAYRLIARGTVEERVLELQAKKRHLAQAILSEDNAVLRDLTREDLEKLLA